MYKFLANTIFLGKDVHFLPECHSTNDKALSFVKKRQIKEGTIIISNFQSKGKGQRGNEWVSEAGKNLTFSIVLSPNFLDISEQFILNMAVSNAIRRLLGDYVYDLKVKWPNDIIVPGEGKLVGVLIENIFGSEGWEFAVVGIGINVNQVRNLPPKASSMALLTGSQFDLVELFKLLVIQIEQSYIRLKRGKGKEIREEYLNHLFLLDKKSRFESREGVFEGAIKGVDKVGNLIIEKNEGERNLFGIKELRFLEG